MRTAEVVNLEQDERSSEMVALLNMIIYAQAIARDLKLGNSEFYLSNAIDDLSHEIAKGINADRSSIGVASLTIGRAGNC